LKLAGKTKTISGGIDSWKSWQGSLALDDRSLKNPSRRWRNWTEIFKLVTIKIPVANISPDDDRSDRFWETRLEKSIYEQLFRSISEHEDVPEALSDLDGGLLLQAAFVVDGICGEGTLFGGGDEQVISVRGHPKRPGDAVGCRHAE